MGSQEKYLKPEVIRQVKRLDLRAKFIIEGFISGLHASPFQGFSSEFSEHRKYSEGDDPNAIDWNVYARTDRYYIKKFQAETNLTGFLAVDLSASMGNTDLKHLAHGPKAADDELSKFDYAICLAASLTYMMIHQSDAVGLVTFDSRIRASLPARSRRTQLSDILALLSRSKPDGVADFGAALQQLSAMIRHKSLVVLFSDLIGPGMEQTDRLVRGIHQLKHRGHDVILFHILDQAEVDFPLRGMVELMDNESATKMIIDADGIRETYLATLNEFREGLKKECTSAGVDFVPIHTGMPFDKALVGYLSSRAARF